MSAFDLTGLGSVVVLYGEDMAASGSVGSRTGAKSSLQAFLYYRRFLAGREDARAEGRRIQRRRFRLREQIPTGHIQVDDHSQLKQDVMTFDGFTLTRTPGEHLFAVTPREIDTEPVEDCKNHTGPTKYVRRCKGHSARTTSVGAKM